MVQLGSKRVITLLGRGDTRGCLTNPSQEIGRRSLTCAPIPGPLSFSHLIVDVMSLSMCRNAIDGNMGPGIIVICVYLCLIDPQSSPPPKKKPHIFPFECIERMARKKIRNKNTLTVCQLCVRTTKHSGPLHKGNGVLGMHSKVGVEVKAYRNQTTTSH